MAVLSLTAISASAVRAYPGTVTLTLANGEKIQVKLNGDEHGHWYVDSESRRFTLNGDNTIHYLTDSEFTQLQNNRKSRLAKSNARRQARLRKMVSNSETRTFTPMSGYTGKKKGLVILVNFTDKQMTSKGTNAEFNDMFNKEGYSNFGNSGSVHDYFSAQSYGKFDLTFDVVGPITLSHNMKYYGENRNGTEGEDKHPGELVAEACRKVADLVNFSDYDWDGDGEVDQVFIIYAGYNEAWGAEAYTIWPHEFSLSGAQYYGDGEGPITLDNVVIDTYAMTSELSGTKYQGSTIAGIGTACHEFSHCLGLPDFYDTDPLHQQNPSPGMLSWDLMCEGSYNGKKLKGGQPQEYTAFERYTAGWLTPVTLSATCKVSDMPAISDEAVAYIIRNDGYDDEFYMLENKQYGQWHHYDDDGGEMGHGLFITHIDYADSIWMSNEVNNVRNHQRMTFFPASGIIKSANKSITFPGSMNRTEFTDESLPAATLYNANADGKYYMGKPVTDIDESSNGLISFAFMKASIVPTELTAEATTNGYNVSWNAVDEAESYDIMLMEVNPVSPFIAEDFSNEAFNIDSDNTISLPSNLDSYMQAKGWTANRVYASTHSVKLGSSKGPGVLTSPSFSSDSTAYTVRIKAKYYNTDNSKLTVSLFKGNSSTPAQSQVKALTSDAADYTFSFSNLEKGANYHIVISSDKRSYVSGINISRGQSSAGGSQYTSVTEINGITETTIYLDQLEAGHTYEVVVRTTVNGGEKSAWSSAIELSGTGSATAISATPADQQRPAAVYNLNGQRLPSEESAHGIVIINGKKFLKP
ncbi:MAG: M6 family metalloprotease domain-containing protein [Bacteroidaceae bacterium]|nr:M6 family metalloprotease domain-containing protein [Bacteroidaceae bacterium]